LSVLPGTANGIETGFLLDDRDIVVTEAGFDFPLFVEIALGVPL
jgi:hypothetical protein